MLPRITIARPLEACLREVGFDHLRNDRFVFYQTYARSLSSDIMSPHYGDQRTVMRAVRGSSFAVSSPAPVKPLPPFTAFNRVDKRLETTAKDSHLVLPRTGEYEGDRNIVSIDDPVGRWPAV